MNKLYVFADFDWLREAELVGELGYESLRGADSYSFKFDNGWLQKHSDISLSEDLNNYPGQQYTLPGKDIFGCFADALPDRWGRTLLNRREQILASEEQRPIRRLSSYDYLTTHAWAHFVSRSVSMASLSTPKPCSAFLH